MPYSVPSPAPAPLPIHSQGRPGHRRAYSAHQFSDERGPGAFAPLGLLPRRTTNRAPVFHFRNDDDDSSPDELTITHDDDFENSPPALVLKPNSSFRLSLNTDNLPKLRFPPLAPSPTITTARPPIRPSVSRTTSTPVLLSNGKPLKSSLKSSSSAPHLTPPQNAHHLRALSAPSTPHTDLLNSPSPSPSPASSPLATPATPKYVHFPSQEDGGLETVRIFSRSARPASLSVNGDDTETETEGEGGYASKAFPFPRLPTSLFSTERKVRYELDPSTSPIPSPVSALGTSNVLLESLSFPASPESHTVAGTLLVRNIAYEKHIAVRFTLDDWQTTSEVVARYTASLPALPATFTRSAAAAGLTLGDVVVSAAAEPSPDTPAYDRFSFTLRLEDYAFRLNERVLWLVVRYTAGAGGAAGEWWDNNGGLNYRVGFKEVGNGQRGAGVGGRRVVVSAPAMYTAAKPPSPPPRLSTPPIPSTSAIPSYAMQRQQHPSSNSAAIAQTTLLRLRKLNLKNYAAPSRSPPSTSMNLSGARSLMQPDEEHVRSPPAATAPTPSPPMHMPSPLFTPTAASPPAVEWGSGSATPTGTSAIGGHPATPPPAFSSSTTPGDTNGALHWLWGSAPSPSRKDDSSSSDGESISGSASSSAASTPPTSPLLGGEGRDLGARTSSIESVLELTPPRALFPRASPPPPPRAQNEIDTALPKMSAEVRDAQAAARDPDSVYQAFVRQWCFAQGPGTGGVVVG